jgi:predicted ABC-type ATPase
MKFQEYLTESINDKGIMKAIILGGLSASGKSTVIRTVMLDGSFPIAISNTDKWTEYYSGGDWAKIGGKVKQLSNKDIQRYINSLRPVYVDSVSGNMTIFSRRVNILKALGYDVKMVFVKTGKRTSIKRVLDRNKGQSRQASTDFIKDTFDKFYCKGEYDTKGCTDSIAQYTKFLDEPPIIVDANDNMLIDDVVKKIHNKVVGFLKSPIKNKKGKLLIDYMRKNGYKYYNEVPEEWLQGHGFPRPKDISYY